MIWRPPTLRLVSCIILIGFTVPSVTLAAPIGALYQDGSAYEYLPPKAKTAIRAPSLEELADVIRDTAIPISKNELQTIPIDIPELFLEEDRDIDGLPDVFEQALGTNPDKEDTDNDHLTDFLEILAETDPLGAGSFSINPSTITKYLGAAVVDSGVYWYVDSKQRRRIWIPIDSPELLKIILEPLLQPLPAPLPLPIIPPTSAPSSTASSIASPKPALPPKQTPKPPQPAIPIPIKPPVKPSKPPIPPKPTSTKPVLPPSTKPKPQPTPKPRPIPAPKSAKKTPVPSPKTSTRSVSPTKPAHQPISDPTPTISPTLEHRPDSSSLTPILTPEPLPYFTSSSVPTKPNAPIISSSEWRAAAEALPFINYQKDLLTSDRLRVTSDNGAYQVEVPNIGPNAELFARFQLRKLKLDTETTEALLGSAPSTKTIFERFIIDPQAKAVGSCCGTSNEPLPLTWYYPTESAFLEAADLGRPEHAWILDRFWNVASGNHELIHRLMSDIPLPNIINEGLANYIPSRIVKLGPGLECRRDGYLNGDGRLIPYQTFKEPDGDHLYPSGECFWWLLDQRYGDAVMQQLLRRLQILPARSSLPLLTNQEAAGRIMNTVIVPIVGEEARDLLAAFWMNY